MTCTILYNEITQRDKYSVQECENFASILANYDLRNGTKRFLVSYGMFYTGCYTCLHYKYGYSETDLGSNCEYYETAQAFKSKYNAVMKSILEEHELADLEKAIPSNKVIFTSYLTTLLDFDYKRKKKNDTLVYFQIYSDTLEYLFKDNIRFLKISVTLDSIRMEYDYLEVKTNGAVLNTKGRKQMDILILLDFRDMPTDYDICWCTALEKKYRFKLPINLKK
jgi:hypothetical protein